MRRQLYLCLGLAALGACQDTGGPFTGTSYVNRDPTARSCVDFTGKRVKEGRQFTPGHDVCQFCTCVSQVPALCQTLLCQPPTGCKIRMGDVCCQYDCDGWTVSDLGLRLVASAVTAVLSLSLLFFLIYRLRQRKLRGRRNHLEAESFNSISGRPGGDEGDGSLSSSDFPMSWFKPSNDILRRPFPPSYNEAVGAQPPPPDVDLPSEAGSDDQEAPPYASIERDPVISYPHYPVATLGRLVLPVIQLPSTEDQHNVVPSEVGHAVVGRFPTAGCRAAEEDDRGSSGRQSSLSSPRQHSQPAADPPAGCGLKMNPLDRDPTALHRLSLQLSSSSALSSSVCSNASWVTVSPQRTLTPTSQASSADLEVDSSHTAV